ncbi:MAG: hypothetical protein K6G65_05265 [Lachnospiraceae bacterium]|nr:hypothetical protein [Lachnospiraceae bacterium]
MNANEQYNKSMNDIQLSDEARKRILANLTNSFNDGTYQEETKTKKNNIKTVVATGGMVAAAAAIIVGVPFLLKDGFGTDGTSEMEMAADSASEDAAPADEAYEEESAGMDYDSEASVEETDEAAADEDYGELTEEAGEEVEEGVAESTEEITDDETSETSKNLDSITAIEQLHADYIYEDTDGEFVLKCKKGKALGVYEIPKSCSCFVVSLNHKAVTTYFDASGYRQAYWTENGYAYSITSKEGITKGKLYDVIAQADKLLKTEGKK